MRSPIHLPSNTPKARNTLRLQCVALAVTSALCLSACGSGGEDVDKKQLNLCRAPDAVSNNPRNIEEVVVLINALPKPLTLPCFLETLARPLYFNSTKSKISAQPAQTKANPRVFLFFDPLIMSVVPAGPGRALLEFGEQTAEGRTLKGELEFPINEELPLSAPFDSIMMTETATTCSVCHTNETRDERLAYPNAYVSKALRPGLRDRVLADFLRQESELCDAEAAPERCAMLSALFSQGQVSDHEFPASFGTFP
jgi:hypothetical protein